jgi:hypothetical protein
MSSDPDDRLLDILYWFVGSCPLYILYIVGIVIALTRWSRNPRPALLTLLAFVGLFVLSVIGMLVFTQLPRTLLESGNMDFATYRIVVVAIHLVISVLNALLLGLLLLAVFVSRRHEAAPPREREEGPAGEPGRPSRKDTGIQEGRGY